MASGGDAFIHSKRAILAYILQDFSYWDIKQGKIEHEYTRKIFEATDTGITTIPRLPNTTVVIASDRRCRRSLTNKTIFDNYSTHL
ncbi:MAG: hypothetical protein SAK29_40690 [Scytonema sp. PMC 1069.18]|nr:hypothetical protein [Scytonema sp. PMC 1069.18]MEC4887604.1 hypothetical protein [Scytonema sp. PMC 1070.18]